MLIFCPFVSILDRLMLVSNTQKGVDKNRLTPQLYTTSLSAILFLLRSVRKPTLVLEEPNNLHHNTN